MTLDSLAPLLEAEAAALIIGGGLWLHGRVTGKNTIERILATAKILTNTVGHSWRHPLLAAKAVWRGSPDSLPRFFAIVIVPGVLCPIPGPIDESAAAIAIAAVTVSPALRVKVKAAWQAATS